MDTKKVLSLLLTTLLLIGATAIIMPTRAHTGTGKAHVEIVPNFQEFGDPINHEENVVGRRFNITIEVHDVDDLYGLDIQIKWDTTWIHYVRHWKMIPVETNPGGILHSPTIPVKNDVDESASMPGSAPGTMYWLAEASMAPAQPFSGSGIAAKIEFVIWDQPVEPAPDVTTWIQFTSVTLSDSTGIVIPQSPPINGEILIRWIKFTYPPLPLLKVMPEEVKDIRECNNFVSSIWLMNEDHEDLNPLWDIAGFDIMYNFDPTLIEAVNVTIDPDGWFASFWPGGLFIVKQEINNTAGTVWIVFLGLPNPGDTPPHIPPYGKGRLAQITFHSIFESETYPPPSCPLSLGPTTIAGWPHPERPQKPWNSSETSPPIPHKVEDGTYKAFFKPPGAWIDIYTQYPDGYNGKGPNQPSDMFWPQKEVILYAYVTYNFWPEQQKDVAFEVRDPHGTIWAVLCNRTDEDGIAFVRVRLPWPCDDPEYYFGVWTVTGTVDVACKVVNDTLTFKYDYHVRIWKTTTDKESYKHCNTIAITIDYGTYSMQTFSALFTVTVVDETGVPFGYAWTWDTVGGAEYCTYKNGTFTLYVHVPKFARAGRATIYVQVLHNLPSAGGDAIYPTREPETIIRIGIEAA